MACLRGVHERWTWAVPMSLALLLSCSWLAGVASAAGADYGKALELSILFFQAQRSGSLPGDNEFSWRGNSGLSDGRDQGIDLTGGYYDAGDNVKFGLPMAFTITTLSWSVVEYRAQLQQQGQLQASLEAIKWGTDYFIKTHPEPDVLWAEVGDGDTDHYCWERPEDMTTSRRGYKIDPANPGSEVAAETAAAMASASIAFRSSNSEYSQTLLSHARQLFSFADTHRGRYDSAIPLAKKYYASGPSGYNDDLLWAALWLYEATSDQSYLRYAVNNGRALGGTTWGMTEFGWDVKYAGLQLLAAKVLLEGRGGPYRNTLEEYQKQADFFMCAALGKNSGPQIRKSSGGLFWTQNWNNMQFVTSAALLLTVYGDSLNAANAKLYCGGSPVEPSELLSAGKAQIDYILGNNPRGESYMVGYGRTYPQFVHHRGASIPSFRIDPERVECREGYAVWYSSPHPNPNVLLGAVVGGPDENDIFVDRRDNWEGSEACLYNNGPLVGVLARLSGGSQPSRYGAFAGTASTMTASYHQSYYTHLQSATMAAPLTLDVKLVTWWVFRGVEYFKYEGMLTNQDPQRTLQDVVLSFELMDGPVHGLQQLGNSVTNSFFTFPKTRRNLKPGQSLPFLYISRRSTPFATSLYLSKFA